MTRTGEPASEADKVRLLVGLNQSQLPVFEWVPARPVEPGVWELAATPGLVLGTAAGDRLAVRDDGSFEVVRRSGNLGVWVVGPTSEIGRLGKLTKRFEKLGGWPDGDTEMKGGTTVQRTFTVPFEAGFAAIDKVARSFTDRVPGARWYYVNVYDPDDQVTPLNWWQD